MSKLYALILLGVISGVIIHKLRIKIKYLTLLSAAREIGIDHNS